MSTKAKGHRGDSPYRYRGASEPPFEIREVAEPDGGLCLELHAEGERIATARARGAALADLEGMLGLRRADVRVALESALVDRFEHELTKVDIASPKLATSHGSDGDDGRFVSRYQHQDFEGIAVGVVWYDSSTSTTGSDGVPAIVRSKMRSEVQRKLAEKRPGALRFLVEVLHGVSS
jgi:hypothetical protein